MPWSRVHGTWESPKVDLFIDMGHPFLNRTVDGFLKIGLVGASKAAVEETYHCVRSGSISKHKAQDMLKKMCKEGAYWGSIAGVYVGMEYGAQMIRGTHDWKNAMIGGALTGALVSAASNQSTDKVVVHAITSGAIATAAEFISYLT